MSQSSAQPQSQPTPSCEETTHVEPSLELAREMVDDSSNVVEEVIEPSIDDGHYVLEQLTETPHETFVEETLDISSTSDIDSIATNFVVDWPTDSEPLEPSVRVTVPAPTPFEDLVCAENATKFGCLGTSISLEEPLSDLLIEFLELAVVDTSAGFTCADCEGNFICPVCAEIEACLRGDCQILEDFEVVADIQTVELVETSNVKPTQPLPSIVFPLADETSTIGLECVHTPILRRFEYAYLENDVQLQTIYDITDEFL